jgi:hypothetical protein
MSVFSRFMAGNGRKRGFVFTALLAILAALAMGGCQDEVTRTVYYDVSVPQGIRIETAKQLANIGLVEEYPADGEYYLGNDIDLSVLYEKGEDRFELLPGTPYVWRSIGSTCRECGAPLVPASLTSHTLPLVCINMDCSLYDESQPPFSGTLHGNGKTISGLKLSGGTKNENAKDGGATEGYAGAYYIGLFGYLNNAYIHDLTLEVANTAEDLRVAYNGEYEANGSNPCIAALAALSRSSRIKDINLTAAESAGLYATALLSGSAAHTYVGGALGNGFSTDLTNIISSLPLDVDGDGSQTVGGIAGSAGGVIKNARMTGAITVNSTATSAVASFVAGICRSATAIRNCTVTMDALILNAATTTGSVNTNITVQLSGIGGGLITDCFVDIRLIRLCLDDTMSTSPRPVIVGGINISGNTERCRARFDTLEVIGGENALHGASYIGGLTATTGTAGKVIDSSVEGEGQITIDFSTASDTALYVGGLVGQGSVSRSNIAGGITIDVTTRTTGIVYAGGLTGNGVAEYSSIGSPENRATLNVTKNTASTSAVSAAQAYIGGISGQAPLSTTLPFRYNYAFCDVTLTTHAGSSAPTSSSAITSAGVTVGGLAGTISAAASVKGSFTENYAAGSVILKNEFKGTETTAKVYAGGIAAYSYIGNASSSQIFISKCAALNSVTINGSNITATKTWRHIAYPAADTDGIVFSNNITNVADTQEGSPDPGPNTADGLLVDAVTEDTFFETLGWSRDVWEWDAVSGYPILR